MCVYMRILHSIFMGVRLTAMIEIVQPDAFLTKPWKNHGGITHEIFRRDHGAEMLWRLSLAEVDTDGPFSIFAGMMRILTVIRGNGLCLTAPDETLMALPHQPLRFSGDLRIDSRRLDGAVRDLNLIFDPRRLEASVRMVSATASPGLTPSPGREFVIYCTSGKLGLGIGHILNAGSAARFSSLADAITFSPDAAAVLMTIDVVG